MKPSPYFGSWHLVRAGDMPAVRAAHAKGPGAVAELDILMSARGVSETAFGSQCRDISAEDAEMFGRAAEGGWADVAMASLGFPQPRTATLPARIGAAPTGPTLLEATASIFDCGNGISLVYGSFLGEARTADVAAQLGLK